MDWVKETEGWDKDLGTAGWDKDLEMAGWDKDSGKALK
jgi:hypothetical protein